MQHAQVHQQRNVVLSQQHIRHTLLDVELTERLNLFHENVEEHGLVQSLEDEDTVLNEERV